MKKRRAFGPELLMSLGLLLGSSYIYIQSLRLPSSPYEPLGPGFLPRGLSLLIGILSLLVSGQQVWKILSSAGGTREQQPPGGEAAADGSAKPFTRRPGLALATVGLTFVYIYIMHTRILGFRPATFLFLMVLGNLLFHYERKMGFLVHQVVLAALSLGLSTGLYYVFTKVFFVNLS